MMLGEEIYAQAVLLAGQLETARQELLRVLCDVIAASLAARLKEELTPEDCHTEFVNAGSLYALAALRSVEDTGSVEEFRAGDLTIKQGDVVRDGAADAYRSQADQLMGPYLKDRFSFVGV